ncbi:unnamed protein product, partial [Prorocentrum cordatum]
RRRPRPRRRQAACSCPGPQDPEGRRGRHGGGARASLAAAGHAGQAPGPDVRHLDAREGRGRGSRGRRAHARLVLQVCGEGAGGGPGRGGGRGRAGGRRRRRGGGRGAGRDGLRGASPRPPSLTSCCDHLRARYPYVCSGPWGPPGCAACGLHVSGARLGSARAPRRAPSLRSRAVLARSGGGSSGRGVGTDMAAARGAPGALAPRRPRPLELAGCPAVCAARWAVDTFSVHCLWP